MNNNQQHLRSVSRRDMLIGGAGAVIAAAASTAIDPNAARAQSSPPDRAQAAPPRGSFSTHVTTKDGAQIYFKDWGRSGLFETKPEIPSAS